jgi:hypothetical protein
LIESVEGHPLTCSVIVGATELDVGETTGDGVEGAIVIVVDGDPL